METVTTTGAAHILGLKGVSHRSLTAAARTTLRRMGIEAVGRDTGTGEKLWPAEQIRTAMRSRPRRGYHIDTEGARTMRYTTNRDAIEQAILPALDTHADDYDVDAIFREAFEYRVDTDKDGNELLNTAGFEQVVTDEEFWVIAAKHDKTA